MQRSSSKRPTAVTGRGRGISRYARLCFGAFGFLALSGGMAVLFGLTLSGAWRNSVWIFVFTIVVLLGITVETVLEWRRFLTTCDQESAFSRTDVFDAMAVFGGTLLTFGLSVYLGLNAVTASALAGLGAAFWLRRYAVAVYCGSFVGMASADVFQLWPCMVVAGGVSALVFVAAKRVFNGFGGKLGTTALVGCLAVVFLNPRPLLVSDVPGWNVGVWMLVYAMLAAVATFVLSVRFQRGPVMASAWVGLVAGVLLPLVHGSGPGGAYAAMAFCASFVGMCSTERLVGEHWMAVAGLVCGLSFVLASPNFAGAGGKLGTLAFGSVISLRGLLRIYEAMAGGFSPLLRSRRGLRA